MTYEYKFDDTRLGNGEFPAGSYRQIQLGLEVLLREVETWNRKAKQQGATEEPYSLDAAKLKRMIDFGDENLGKQLDVIQVPGMSVGSARYLRAGLELIIRQRRAELDRNRAEGFPGAVLASIEKAIVGLEALAGKLDVEPAEILWEVLPQEERSSIVQQMRVEDPERLWDVFVSHASDDKDDFVRPLVGALKEKGLRVWYDEFTLKVGDSLRRSIDRGLSRSRYGIVVLSPSFFAKEWPQKEFDGLVAREIDGRKVILPIWYNIGVEGVRRHSPTLADRVAAKADSGLESVVKSLVEVLGGSRDL